MDADEIVALLGLAPHPEGGFYRETFRDERGVEGRAWSTAIYFLLKQGQKSRWHRVDAAEIWHWYAGVSLAFGIATGPVEQKRFVSAPISSTTASAGIVPAAAWQQARASRLDARGLHRVAPIPFLGVSNCRAGV